MSRSAAKWGTRPPTRAMWAKSPDSSFSSAALPGRRRDGLSRYIHAVSLNQGRVVRLRAWSAVAVVSAAGALVTATGAYAGPQAMQRPAPANTPTLPNVVIIWTDDQAPSLTQNMKTVEAQFMAKGVTFTNAHSTTPTCCPSRASLLTGGLSQTTGIWSNWLPDGGWGLFHDLGWEDRTIVQQFDAAGYHTAYVGKYLNGYGLAATRTSVTGDRDYVPPGWDSWHAFAKPSPDVDGRHQGYYDYWLMDREGQGEEPTYSYFGTSSADYSTDVLSARAVQVVETTPSDKPLFMISTVFAPHKPYTVPLRHSNTWNRVKVTLPEGIGDTTGKPSWVQDRQKIGPADAKYLIKQQSLTLLSADEGIADLLDALEATGRLSNTLIVFASDNGLTLGQFNLLGAKNFPYASPIPLVMRWDDAPAGSVLAQPGTSDERLVALPDIAATALDAASLEPTSPIDGQSLLNGNKSRRSLILSAAANRPADEGNAVMPPYCARRTKSWLYVRYSTGFEELYAVRIDPGLLVNVADVKARAKTVRLQRKATQKACSPAPPGFSWQAAG